MTKMDGAPLGLSHGIKVIFSFVVECKCKVCSLAFTNKEGVRILKWD
jgi:hypothetical protein